LPSQVFVQREIYGPLKMTDTGFLPLENGIKLSRIAPTELINGGASVPASRLVSSLAPPETDAARLTCWRGVVHDPTARRMGGVAGHAGLFSTASDVARYARMMLNLGELDGVRIFKPETVKLMTNVQTPAEMPAKRGLGWDIDTAYSGPRGELFPVGSYGHTGWTGGSLWIDPFSKTFVIFLSNRNHPTEAGNVLPLRHQLGTLAAESLEDADFSRAPRVLEPNTNSPSGKR